MTVKKNKGSIMPRSKECLPCHQPIKRELDIESDYPVDREVISRPQSDESIVRQKNIYVYQLTEKRAKGLPNREKNMAQKAVTPLLLLAIAFN